MSKQKYYKFVTRELRDSVTNTIDYSRIGKWIELSEDAIDRDGNACGRGLHLMKIPNPIYVNYEIGFLAEGDDLLGEDEFKARFRRIRLIRPLRFSEIFFPGADLHRAQLESSTIYNASLDKADLRDADLIQTSIINSRLRGADLGGAHLSYAHIRNTDMTGVNLDGAYMYKMTLDCVYVGNDVVNSVRELVAALGLDPHYKG